MKDSTGAANGPDIREKQANIAGQSIILLLIMGLTLAFIRLPKSKATCMEFPVPEKKYSVFIKCLLDLSKRQDIVSLFRLFTVYSAIVSSTYWFKDFPSTIAICAAFYEVQVLFLR
jgi:hypothetical protein